jgi:hypothetical protein
MDKQPWSPDVIHGFTEIGGELVDVTYKEQLNSVGELSDALIAPGHVPDIQPDVDHVHVWGQDTDHPDHHDLREGTPLFPM